MANKGYTTVECGVSFEEKIIYSVHFARYCPNDTFSELRCVI
jgi:hypothetical protein